MRVGDEVLVDDERGIILASSEDGQAFGYLHYKSGPKRLYIGVSPVGNPRVKITRRSGKGRELSFSEWDQGGQ